MEFETRFVVEQVHTALLADSADNAHPLSNPGVGSPQAVSAMFSTITYNKGASIIRQTEHFLGSEVHTQGLINYLKRRSFLTAKPIDLFVDLESVGIETGALEAYGPQFNFIEYYKSWTEQPGHPLLSVNVNHATGRMTITQRRFSINTGFSSAPTNYIVPITFARARDPDFSNTKPSHILTDSVTIIDRGSVGDEWVIFNKQQTGFYRVNYDDYTWNLIALALRGDDRTRIHEYNRAQIVNDLFQFARSGVMTYNRAFNLLAFLENETEYAPWFAAITGINWLRNRLASSPDLLLELNDVVIKWANTVMTQLTYVPRDGESWIESYLRYQLAPLMCAMGVPACRAAATTQFQALRDTDTPVPVDSRNWVYCNALREGTTSDFDFLWDRFLTHNVYTEKIVLLQTLGCTPYNSSLYKFVNAIVSDNFEVRPQDYTTAFSSAVNGNEGNTMIVFAYIQDYLDQVTQAFNSATTPLAYISSRLRTESQVLEFQRWVNDSRADLGDDYQAVYNNANAALESIQWVQDVSSDLNDYFTGDDITFDTTTSSSTTTEQITTVTPGLLVEPITPEFPNSAVSTAVSLLLLSLGVTVHWFF
ncbi:membrane alanyl aminopeptidase-like [Hyposmocoma kahamanoa]|uniref:membrane alanyl aminopeptidase-like n=1 Tax=Hyposmocoma kahamanoa TaxID=1477025 RepID=UPI000E6D6116|nr:membrane alanyl aminopeptidase-like [Hyposmocoma kahamanoa]